MGPSILLLHFDMPSLFRTKTLVLSQELIEHTVDDGAVVGREREYVLELLETPCIEVSRVDRHFCGGVFEEFGDGDVQGFRDSSYFG